MKAPRWVCDECNAVWYAAPQGKCPSCGGSGKLKQVEIDENGVAVLPKSEP